MLYQLSVTLTNLKRFQTFAGNKILGFLKVVEVYLSNLLATVRHLNFVWS